MCIFHDTTKTMPTQSRKHQINIRQTSEKVA
nr:MAG TPA: hypothetical protein [Caudoviricetes sp.]